MDREALRARVRALILGQLAEGERLGRDAVIRAASFAEAVLQTARGATPEEFVIDSLARLKKARAEWVSTAVDEGGHGAAALDEMARELGALQSV